MINEDKVNTLAQSVTDLCQGISPKDFGRVLNKIFETEENPFFIQKKDHHKNPIEVIIPPNESPQRL